MGHQGVHVALEELLRGALEALQAVLRLDQMRLDALGVITDETRHLHTDQQAGGEQHQPQITEQHRDVLIRSGHG